MKVSVLVVLLLVSVALADRVFIESNEPRVVPKGWRVSASQVISQSQEEEQRQIIFLLKQRNVDVVEKMFWEVSDPNSPKYGEHLTLEQLAELVSPSEETINTVQNFLASYGIVDTKTVVTKDFLYATVPVRILKEMFAINFKLYEHSSGAQFYASMGPYSLPEEVAKCVDFVSFLLGVPDVESPSTASERQSKTRSTDITPDVIRARYNCSNVVATSSKNSHAVAEFQGQSYSPSDLSDFFSKYVTNSNDDTVDQVIGSNNPDKPGIEASLDIQYLMGVAPNVTTWFYGMKQFNFYEDLTNWLGELNNETDAPWVHSVSYGSQGNYPTQTYMTRSDTEYQKLGLRGLSIIYASGDSGAECSRRCSILYPSYPATSTYVTAIGATRFLSGNSGAEGSVLAFKSGGGFSTWNAVPSYQASATAAYLDQNIEFPPPDTFNSSNRANPDFGALGAEHFQVVVDGKTTAVGGTSASAPTFAAIVTMLNDLRLSSGKSTLGFLNTLFYQIAENTPGAFFDVVDGNNKNGCPGNACGTNYIDGYLCAPGWDPVTGYGTPNYGVLATAV